jgi:hypothetical protein
VAGLPDVLAVKGTQGNGHWIMVDFKSATGQPTALQLDLIGMDLLDIARSTEEFLEILQRRSRQ